MPHLEVGGAKLYYRLDGPEDAPVLVLSSSLGTIHDMWEPQMAALVPHFRVLRYDTRGHGASGVSEGPYAIEGLGHDVLALMDALGIERVSFCGLSMGGMIGMWLGINAPERLTRLALCNTSARIGSPEVWNQRIATVREHGMAAIVPGVIERWLTAPFRERWPRTVARLAAMLQETPAEGYVACCAAVRDMDQLDFVRRITVPTLVVAGIQDFSDAAQSCASDRRARPRRASRGARCGSSLEHRADGTLQPSPSRFFPAVGGRDLTRS